MKITYFADNSINDSDDAGISNDIDNNIPVSLEEYDCIELGSEVQYSQEISLKIICIDEHE